MHKILAVIRREVLTRVRTRMFLIGTILGPILLASLVVLPVIIAGRDRDARRIVVLDTDGAGLGARVEQVLAASRRGDKPDGQPRYVVTRVEAQGRVQAVLDSLVALTGVRDLGAASPTGIVVVGEDALVSDTLQYYGANAQSEGDMRVLGATLATAVRLERLAREGVIGRFAVDFVAVRSNGGWSPYAVEINLRNGGTSHPVFTLQALTDGEYEEGTGRFVADDGTPKHYVATDDLESPAYRSLTPDDALDIAEAEHIGWDDERQTGVALHMVSAIAVAGRIGLTAIGDSPDEADALYRNVKSVLDAETRAAVTADA